MKRGSNYMKRMSLRFLFGSTLLLTTVAHAGLILDTGLVTFAPSGNQFGRISRDGLSAVWGEIKAFPGVLGAPATRAYQTFTIHNLDRTFLQISLDDPDAVFFDAAYRNNFNPVNVAPNFGLDVNYLGDPGSSQPAGNPSFFQIVVPTNSTIVIVLNEVNPGGGAGHRFELVVESFYDSSFSEVPEPSSLLLAGSVLLLLLALRHRPLAFFH